MISPSPYLSGTPKRILDWALALVLFVPLHAILFIAMAWMWLRGDRLLFYTQQRIGLHGRPLFCINCERFVLILMTPWARFTSTAI